MRTTLTLEKDVAVVIQRLRRSRGQPLKVIINTALRVGLKQLGQPSATRTPFVTGTVDLGQCRLGNIDNVADVLALVESDAFR